MTLLLKRVDKRLILQYDKYLYKRSYQILTNDTDRNYYEFKKTDFRNMMLGVVIGSFSFGLLGGLALKEVFLKNSSTVTNVSKTEVSDVERKIEFIQIEKLKH